MVRELSMVHVAHVGPPILATGDHFKLADHSVEI